MGRVGRRPSLVYASAARQQSARLALVLAEDLDSACDPGCALPPLQAAHQFGFVRLGVHRAGERDLELVLAHGCHDRVPGGIEKRDELWKKLPIVNPNSHRSILCTSPGPPIHYVPAGDFGDAARPRSARESPSWGRRIGLSACTNSPDAPSKRATAAAARRRCHASAVRRRESPARRSRSPTAGLLKPFHARQNPVDDVPR